MSVVQLTRISLKSDGMRLLRPAMAAKSVLRALRRSFRLAGFLSVILSVNSSCSSPSPLGVGVVHNGLPDRQIIPHTTLSLHPTIQLCAIIPLTRKRSARRPPWCYRKDQGVDDSQRGYHGDHH